MEKLKVPAITAKPGSQLSRPASATVPALRMMPGQLPKISNQLTDVDIPRSAWANWVPEVGNRQLRRPLDERERAALIERRDELAPALLGYDSTQIDVVALAVSDLFGSYRSMRHTGDDAAAVLDGTMRMLKTFPAWAIEKVCRSMQLHGVWRDGKYDKQWAPNDSEIASAIWTEISYYERRHREVVALLEATVEVRS